jgi:glycosyltransferase involved in cell wall biosynthesis
VNGVLVPAFDAGALAQGILSSIAEDRRPTLRENARRTALERFELQTVSERYRALYRGLDG